MKKSENKTKFEQRDFMSDIVSESNESVCSGIGRKSKYLSKIVDGNKEWYKHCPSCGSEQTYTAKRSIWMATKENRVCYSCKNKDKNNPFFGKTHTSTHRHLLSQKQQKCSYRYKKLGCNPPKIKLICRSCQAPFEVTQCRKTAKYCTYECAARDLFGFGDFHKTIPEQKCEAILKDCGEPYQYGYYLSGKIYDFFLPSRRLLVEIDGIYWHGKGLSDEAMNPTQKANRVNDLKKVAIAKENGYSIVRIWEDEISEEKVSECIRTFL